MLSKAQRLNLKTSFRWVASGKSVTTNSFKLFYRFGQNETALVGVSLRSSEFKKSVLRNKAKRICFELARQSYDQLPKGLNLVIMPRAQILETNSEKLSTEFKNALSSLKTD